jgi:hypothetical protein
MTAMANGIQLDSHRTCQQTEKVCMIGKKSAVAAIDLQRCLVTKLFKLLLNDHV